MDELLAEFLTESAENLSQLDLDLVSLEQNPNDKELLGNIFRTIHTIKGTCGFIGLPRLEKVAHTGENLLGKFRDDELQVTEEAITLILQCIDCIKEIFDILEESGEEPEGDDSELLQRLNDMLEGKTSASNDSETPSETPDVEEAQEQEASTTAVEGGPQPEATDSQPALKEVSQQESAPAPTPAPAPVAQKAKPKTKGPATDNSANQTIRVNVSLLETLINTVSELVLTRNQLLQMMRTQENDEYAVPLQRLNHITTELQEGVMKTRMQPIGGAWSKLPRLVRDLSQEVGKKINLDMIGAETELDRQVIELIKDPLTHMVRNSADHGLETTEQRIEVGKPETGKITLNAYHAGGHVIIEIADDGKGLPVEIIKDKIIANGLAPEEAVKDMSDKQIFQYIFRAGFSTAQKVTSVSGRGVGMDVVRSNIEKIGGTIEVNSVSGKGTTFVIKIPLTLAVVSALIVDSGGQRFALPQVSIIELVQTSRNSECTIEYIKNNPVLRLRNNLLPVVVLKELMEIEEKKPLVQESHEQQEGENENQVSEKSAKIDAVNSVLDQDTSEFDKSFIIVTQLGSQHFGIVVDKVYDTQEIVVKPVSNVLRGIDIYAGNTILGDGSVVMILDPKGIAAGMTDLEMADSSDSNSEQHHLGSRSQKMSFLTFETGDLGSKAVPLTSIVRLEEINLQDIEFSDGQPVVQYRDQLMPIINMTSQMDFNESINKPVLVFAVKGRFAGIMIESIIDIHETVMDLKLSSEKEGVFGSVIIDGKATDVVDTDYIIASHFSHASKKAAKDELEVTTFEENCLFVSKCPFYTNLLKSELSSSGIKPKVVTSLEEADQIIADHSTISAVVFDLSGFEDKSNAFITECQQHQRESLFIIGATNYLDPEDHQKFLDAGGSDYISRNDHSSIINSLKTHFKDTRREAA